MNKSDLDRPPPEVIEKCLCPIDWQSLEGFTENLNDALDALIFEWVRCFDRHSISYEDSYLLFSIAYPGADFLYRKRPDEEQILRNIFSRRERALSDYMSGVGRLMNVQFLRPSEQGKHFSIKGPRKNVGKQSFFYVNAHRATIAAFFWHWLDDTFMTEQDHLPDPSTDLEFARDVDHLWDILRHGRSLRIAINTVVAIGELDGKPLNHLALDIDLDARLGHAYPITSTEAVAIMRAVDVRPLKPIQDLRRR